MIELSRTEMTEVQGGGLWDFIDGACAVVAAGVLLTGGALVVHPAGAVAAGACTIYGAVRIFT